MTHISVKQIDTGEWAIVGAARGNVILTFATRQEAEAGCQPLHTMTAAQGLARIGAPIDKAASNSAYEATLVHRFTTGLPLTKSDKREARRIIRQHRI